MTKPDCPIPAVEDALTPYIHTREKTTRIRQILTEHLTHQVTTTDTKEKSTHLSLSAPTTSLQTVSSAGAGKGLYEEYLRALRANQAARERYDGLKDDLAHLLQTPNPRDESNDTPSFNIQEYTTLLRLRRHKRKLELVQDALTKLLNVDPNPASLSIKEAVRAELGEPPQAPVAASATGGDADAEGRVRDLTFALKKELLLAKNRFAEAKAAKEDGSHESREQRDAVEILREARDELISWVESELAKIPEEDVEASQAEISFLGAEEDEEDGGERLTNEQLEARVGTLYERYLTARQRYIHEVEAAMSLQIQGPKLDPNTTVGALFPPSKRDTITAAHLLPTLTHLNLATQSTTQLQAQTVHLRRQLTLASAEQAALLQRLAGESLLVSQDSATVGSWVKAVQEAGGKTKDSVMASVIEGEASVAQARKVMEGLRGRRNALEGLRRDL